MFLNCSIDEIGMESAGIPITRCNGEREIVAVFDHKKVKPESPENRLAVNGNILPRRGNTPHGAKKIGDVLELDGQLYIICSWRDEKGVSVVTLKEKI